MTHQDNSHLEIEDRGAILIVRVDGGPHSLFGVDIANELDELVGRVDRDPSVHAVVFTGARPGRFVSHADVRWLQAEGAAVPDLNRRGASAVLRLARGVDRARVPEPVLRRTPLRGAAQLDRLHATFLRMNASGVIFVAALNGSALGLGAEFAWACDLRVMADGEFFIGQPEVLLGIMPGGGGSQRLTRLIGTHKSLVAILEGKPFTPAQALANGAVDDVVAPDEVVTRAAELAEYFGKRTKGSVEAIKRSVYFGGSMSLSGRPTRRAHRVSPDRSVRGRAGTDAPVPLGYGLHRRAAPLPPGHLRASARIGPGARGRLDQRGGEPVMSTAQPYTRHDVSFTSGEDTCAAWLYLPAGVTSPPVVILGHGLGATREMRLDAFAQRFAQAGIAALAFTYRHFGDSGGQPRQLLSIKRQLADWDAAIAWVKNRRDVDGTRIAVWGSSFGGGHSITVASRHPELKAAVAQCPFTDGLASALALGPAESLKVLPSVARDFVSMVFRRPPAMIPLAGPPGSLALMNAPDALPGYEALLPPDTTFRNEVAARVAPTIATYRPGRAAKKIKFPILFCVSNTDSVTPPAQTLRYARTAPRGEIKRYDAGHFDFYLGEPFEALVRDQVEFLTRQLQPAATRVRCGRPT